MDPTLDYMLGTVLQTEIRRSDDRGSNRRDCGARSVAMRSGTAFD